MKKAAVFSIAISFAINAVCLLTNLIGALSFGFLPLGMKFYGGEATEAIGFGVYLLTVYSFGPIEEASSTTTTVRFDLLSFLVPCVLLFAIVLVVKILAGKIIKNKRHPSGQR